MKISFVLPFEKDTKHWIVDNLNLDTRACRTFCTGQHFAYTNRVKVNVNFNLIPHQWQEHKQTK